MDEINSPSNSCTNTPRSRARKQVFEYRVLYSDDETTLANDKVNAESAGTPKTVKKIRMKKVMDSPKRYIVDESDGETPEISEGTPKTVKKIRMKKVTDSPKCYIDDESDEETAKISHPRRAQKKAVSHKERESVLEREESLPKSDSKKKKSVSTPGPGKVNNGITKTKVFSSVEIERRSRNGRFIKMPAKLREGSENSEEIIPHPLQNRPTKIIVRKKSNKTSSRPTNESPSRPKRNLRKLEVKDYNLDESSEEVSSELGLSSSDENSDGWENFHVRKLPIVQNKKSSDESSDNSNTKNGRIGSKSGDLKTAKLPKYQSNGLKELPRKRSSRNLVDASMIIDPSSDLDEECNGNNKKNSNSPSIVKSSQSVTPRKISARHSVKNKLERKESFRKTPIHRPDSDSSSDDDFIVTNKTVKSFGSVTPVKKSARLNQKDKSTDVTSIHKTESEREKKTPTTKSGAKLKRSATKPIKKNLSSDDEEFPCTPLQTKRKRSVIEKTPKSSSVRVNLLTPSMPLRDDSVATPSTPLEEARARLHVSAVPKVLLCREVIFRKIELFLEGRIMDRCGGSMYISGVPGTGKTATVRHVISSLCARVAAGDLEKFEYVEVNGMRMTTPHQVYVQILQALTGEKASWEQSMKTLEKYFNRKNKKTTIVLVDELDLICNKRQDIIYNLLDWPRKPDSRLVVLTIANTMDLPEKLLSAKVTSRMGLNRSIFKPYSSSELEEIVTSRLSGIEAFEVDAVRLVAKKVASISGDCRRALDICRRATEVAESEATKVETPKKRKSIVQSVVMVTMTHVQSVLEEMMSSFKIKAIKGLSRMEQLFLRSVATTVELGTDQTEFQKVYPNMQTFCTLEGIKVPTVTDLLHICSKLSTLRMIICQHSKHDIRQKILLNCDADDIHWALTNINND